MNKTCIVKNFLYIFSWNYKSKGEQSIFFDIEIDKREINHQKEKARRLRQSAWWRRRVSRGVCHYCGRHFDPRELTMDHIVPLIRGGKSAKGNLVPACKDCNNKKKYLLPVEWDEYMEDILNIKMENEK